MFDEDQTLSEGASVLIPETTQDRAPTLLKCQAYWPNIARDIAMMVHAKDGTPITFDQIIQTYQLTPLILQDLMTFKPFQKIYKQVYKEIETLGPDAGATLKFRAMALDLTEHAYLRFKGNPAEKSSDLNKLIELTMKAGGFMIEKSQQQQQTNVTVPIQVNIPVLENPKLSYLTTQTRVIEDADKSYDA